LKGGRHWLAAIEAIDAYDGADFDSALKTAANYAAKLAEMDSAYPTWITHRVYDYMNDERSTPLARTCGRHKAGRR